MLPIAVVFAHLRNMMLKCNRSLPDISAFGGSNVFTTASKPTFRTVILSTLFETAPLVLLTRFQSTPSPCTHRMIIRFPIWSASQSIVMSPSHFSHAGISFQIDRVSDEYNPPSSSIRLSANSSRRSVSPPPAVSQNDQHQPDRIPASLPLSGEFSVLASGIRMTGQHQHSGFGESRSLL